MLQAIALAAILVAALATRHRSGAGLALVACAGVGIGVLGGAARLRAIDAGAFRGPDGERIAVSGHLVAVPRPAGGLVRIQLDTPAGKLLIEGFEPIPDLSIGDGLRATGTLALPPTWQRETLRRQGIARLLRATRLVPTGADRSGLLGRLDAVRKRAEVALATAMPEREAALARGFVLGQDDRIDPVTEERFRRSGLSHLLAVSGQNVLLLVLLASPLLGLLGVPLRWRLICLLALIAVYVPLAGAGASIQRAGVMGAAALVALMAGRPAPAPTRSLRRRRSPSLSTRGHPATSAGSSALPRSSASF